MNSQRTLTIWLLLMVFCAIDMAAQPHPLASSQQAVLELKQRADAASGAECARLSLQAARQLLEEANREFGAGNPKTAHEEVDSSLHYARRSVDCSLQARKGEKSTEIELRKLIRRIKDVTQTLDSEDRPHLTRAIIELDKQRDRVLRGIFGAAAPGGATEKKP